MKFIFPILKQKAAKTHNMTLKIHKNGQLYTVEGNYRPYWSGTYWQPPEASEFDITSVKDENGVEMPDMFDDEIEYAEICNLADEQHYEEENTYWAQYAKDKDAGLA